MGEPCKQEGPIAALRSDNTNLLGTLHRIEENQCEFIKILQEISQQSEQIRTLFVNDNRHDKSIDNYGERIRELELAPGKQATTMQISVIAVIVSTIIAYIAKKFGG